MYTRITWSGHSGQQNTLKHNTFGNFNVILYLEMFLMILGSIMQF